jgi:hypothetical protein
MVLTAIAPTKVLRQREQGSVRRAGASGRHAVRGRARAALLSGLAALAMLWGGAAFVVEGCVPCLIDPSYDSRLQYIRRARSADPARTCTVVILGSSRAYTGLHAPRLDPYLSAELGRPVSVANLSMLAQLFLYDLVTWRRLQRDGVRPDLLIIEVLPALLYGDDPGQLDQNRMPTKRLGLFDLPVAERYAPGVRPHLGRDVALNAAATVYSRRFAITSALAPELVVGQEDTNTYLAWDINREDWLPRDPTPDMRAVSLADSARGFGVMVKDFRARRCAMVCELLASARATGVPTALLVMPEGPTYRGWYGPGAWESILAWLDETAREYGAAVINTRDWVDDEEEFLDSHHLLPAGADRFTDRLGREQLLPLLRRLEERR